MRRSAVDEVTLGQRESLPSADCATTSGWAAAPATGGGPQEPGDLNTEQAVELGDHACLAARHTQARGPITRSFGFVMRCKR